MRLRVPLVRWVVDLLFPRLGLGCWEVRPGVAVRAERGVGGGGGDRERRRGVTGADLP